MAIVVGPYSFSQTDLRRTLHHASEVLALQAPAGAAQAERRARVEASLRAVDAMRDPIDELVPVLTDVWADLLGGRADLVEAGALPARAAGRVHQLNASGGGVPKRAVPAIDVGFAGVVGDRHVHRVHHGRPWQALCLWSLEVIESLAADGHPVAPGSAGENVTIAGVPWADVLPGVHLRVGTVLCQAVAYALPCRQIAGCFRDGDVGRVHHQRGPVSRMYAVVLEPGVVSVGDSAVLEPD